MAMDTVLKILQIKREQEKVEAEQDHEEMDDGPALATNQDENMADEVGQTPVDNLDNALKVSVNNATKEFGFAPLWCVQWSPPPF